jgi:hypothetical protein
MEPMKLPAGYLLPEGKTMADIRQIDLELLASEGLDIEPMKADDASDESLSEDADE